MPQAATQHEPETLAERYESVRGRIAAAAERTGRRGQDVLLVAVTKFAEPEQIRELVTLGHRDLGENKVQQLVQRASQLEESLSRQRVLPHARSSPVPEVRWHMIGHLQRNKARKAIEFSRLIHSVDSLRLAEEIQVAAMRREQPVDVLIQVNCSGEASKFGCPGPAAVHLAEQIDTMVSVRLRGLMTMAPLIENSAAAREAAIRTFARGREAFEEIQKAGVGEGRFNILSMGMSGDFEEAIAEGANLVRVGSAIFGEPRTPPAAEPDEDG
ncbi:MAG: YggS family pyridoxal phosphate-dependent enzyme [Phycisphaerales bacterium]|nr:YggS family pyridoxal phosphate-dependent enzyme [Phycisphaerales bacterium]